MRTGVLLAILLVAFNLRLVIVAVGPLIGTIREETGMSGATAGFLTAIPFLCMGLFALAGIGLVRRFGLSRLLLGSLALVAGGSVLRAWMESPALLIVMTIPIGVGIALAGVSLQGVVKGSFPGHAGAVTGAYVAAMSVGAAIGALTILPFADELGWQGALAVTAVPAGIAVVVWSWVGTSVEQAGVGEVARPPARRPSRIAVVFGLMFGCQCVCFAALIAWVAEIYIEAGWTPRNAALATASIPLLTIPASLVLTPLSDRTDRRLWVAGTALALVLGLVGMAAAPTVAAWLWLGLAGIGLGAIFPLILALALDHSDDALKGFDVSAWMLAIGFSMAAAGPVFVGALRDLAGGFEAGIAVLAALAGAAGILALTAVPRRGRSVVETPL